MKKRRDLLGLEDPVDEVGENTVQVFVLCVHVHVCACMLCVCACICVLCVHVGVYVVCA